MHELRTTGVNQVFLSRFCSVLQSTRRQNTGTGSVHEHLPRWGTHGQTDSSTRTWCRETRTDAAYKGTFKKSSSHRYQYWNSSKWNRERAQGCQHAQAGGYLGRFFGLGRVRCLPPLVQFRRYKGAFRPHKSECLSGKRCSALKTHCTSYLPSPGDGSYYISKLYSLLEGKKK